MTKKRLAFVFFAVVFLTQFIGDLSIAVGLLLLMLLDNDDRRRM